MARHGNRELQLQRRFWAFLRDMMALKEKGNEGYELRERKRARRRPANGGCACVLQIRRPCSGNHPPIPGCQPSQRPAAAGHIAAPAASLGLSSTTAFFCVPLSASSEEGSSSSSSFNQNPRRPSRWTARACATQASRSRGQSAPRTAA